MVNTVAAPFDRTVLPIPEPEHPPITEIDARKATAPPRFEVKAPPGAPNVMVILLDNLGYGASKTFGGVINMPTLDRLAANGLIYNNFHVKPICSPSRVALLTGRNCHSANMGSISEMATAFPGPDLRASEQRGATREDPEAQRLQHGDVRQVPRIRGLGKRPHRAVRPVAHRAGVRAVLRQRDRRVRPVLPGRPRQHDAGPAIEGPELLLPDRHRGQGHRLDQGAEVPHSRQALLRLLRRAGHARPGAGARRRGETSTRASSIRAGTSTARRSWRARRSSASSRPTPSSRPKPDIVPDWDTLSADEKKVCIRYQEVFAAFAELTDYEIGRVMQAVDDMGAMDNTLIIYVTGDNGASPNGGRLGAFNTLSSFNQVARDPAIPARSPRRGRVGRTPR